MGWLDPCQSISIRGPDSRHWTWTHIAPQIQTAIRYLDVTSSARQWIADLYNNVFRAEREVGLSGPQMSPPPVRAEWIQLEGRHGFGLSLSPASSRQVTAPDTDPDAYLPVHPGAAAYCNDTQQSFLDKWGNAIFLTPMILGGLASVLAAAWQFLRAAEPRNGEQALDSLYALGRRIGDENALDVTTLNVAAPRLQSPIDHRRTLLAMQPGGKTRV